MRDMTVRELLLWATIFDHLDCTLEAWTADGILPVVVADCNDANTRMTLGFGKPEKEERQ